MLFVKSIFLWSWFQVKTEFGVAESYRDNFMSSVGFMCTSNAPTHPHKGGGGGECVCVCGWTGGGGGGVKVFPGGVFSGGGHVTSYPRALFSGRPCEEVESVALA